MAYPFPTLFLIVGAPGSGKTWVTSQLEDRFHLIHHDGYIYLKGPKGAYVQAILDQTPKATKPVLIEAPFSMSDTIDPLEKAGYKITPVFIIERPEIHSARYEKRENKPIPKGHITRTNTYLKRAKEGNHFYGTSEQVLNHLKKLDVNLKPKEEPKITDKPEVQAMSWSVVYKKAIQDDGSLLFPERLSKEFLEIQKRKLGSYGFSNQYQNEIIPEEMQTFKKHWIKYWTEVPGRVYNFAMIDPAIGQKKTSDKTGITVVSVDTNTNWYFRVAKGEMMTPSQIVNVCFEIQKQFNCLGIGVESVAYQEALLYMLAEEMRRRKVMLPIKEIRPPTDRTKEARIRGLVPRYEWGQVYHCQGLYDYETQLLQFPRSSRDDILDSAASLEEVIIYPEAERKKDEQLHPSDPGYEKDYIRRRFRQVNATEG